MVDGDANTSLTRQDGENLRRDVFVEIEGTEVRLTQKIEEVETRLGKRIDGVETRLEKKIDGVEGRLEAKIDAVQSDVSRMSNQIDRLIDSMQGIPQDVAKLKEAVFR